MNLFQFMLLLIGVLSGSVGAILLKKGSASLQGSAGVIPFIQGIIASPVLILAFVFYLLPTLIAIYLLKELEISLLQPVLSLTYVATAVLAYFFLGEQISLMRASGIIIIIVGVALVAHS